MKRRKVKEVSPEELARVSEAHRRFALETVLGNQRHLVLEKQKLLADLIGRLSPRSSLSSDEAGAKGKAASPGSSDISLTGWMVPHQGMSHGESGEPSSAAGEHSVSDHSHHTVLVAETPRVDPPTSGSAMAHMRTIPETPFDERGYPVPDTLQTAPEDVSRITQLENEIRATERMLEALDARINHKLSGSWQNEEPDVRG